jgi:hypothetical protein
VHKNDLIIFVSRLASGQVEAAAAYNEFIADMLQKYYNQGHLYVSPPRLLDGAEVCSLLDYNGQYFVFSRLISIKNVYV